MLPKKNNQQPNIFEGQISNGLVWLGVLVGSISCVNALNRFLDFGFSGIWSDILEFYREATGPLRELLVRLPFVEELPDWLPDAVVLYTVLLIAGLRATLLPLRTPDYFSDENTVGSLEKSFPRQGETTADEFMDQLPGDLRERFVSVATLADRFEIVFVVREKPALTVAKRILKCLVLWPIISLEPLRKLRFGMRITLGPWKPCRGVEFAYELPRSVGKGFAMKRWVIIERMKLHGALQIISLPMIVIVFVFLGTYLS